MSRVSRHAAAVGVVVVLAGGCGDNGDLLHPTSGARAVVARYVRAIDRHDGKTICSLFTEDLRKRVQRQIDRIKRPDFSDCGKVVSAFIGYVEDSGQPEWKHVALDGITHVETDGRSARVYLTVTHRIREYDFLSKPPRNVTAAVVSADVLSLENEGGWKLANIGGVLALAGPRFEDSVTPKNGPEPASPRAAAERFAWDYLSGLSAGSVDPCKQLASKPPPSRPCRAPQAASQLLSAHEGPVWEAALASRVSATVAGETASVRIQASERYLALVDGSYVLQNRPVAATMRLKRVGDQWKLAATDLVTAHALGIPVAESRTASEFRGPALLDGASARTCARPHVPTRHCPIQRAPVVLPWHGGKIMLAWLATAGRDHLEIRVRTLTGIRPDGPSRVAATLDNPPEAGVPAPGYLEGASDPRAGNALLVWTQGSIADAGGPLLALQSLLIDSRGRGGRIRTVATEPFSESTGLVPHAAWDSVSRRYLVTWLAGRPTGFSTGTSTDLQSRFISASGIDGGPLHHIAHDVALAGALGPRPGGGWLLAWADPHDPNAIDVPESRFHLAVVSVRGSRTRTVDVVRASALGTPAVGYGKGAHMALVAWPETAGDLTRVRVLARFIDGQGNFHGAPILVARAVNAQYAALSGVSVQVVPLAHGYRVGWTVASHRVLQPLVGYRDVFARTGAHGRQHGRPIPVSPVVPGLFGQPDVAIVPAASALTAFQVTAIRLR